MIRGWACVLIILVGTLAAIPNLPSSHGSLQQSPGSNIFPLRDPNATLTAFNYTYAQADLYTKSSPGATVTPTPNATAGTRFNWLNTVPRTTDGTPVLGSALHFNLTTPSLTAGRQEANWTLTIPQFNCQDCTTVIVRFAFFGNLTRGTYAGYTLTLPTNGTLIDQMNHTGPGEFPTVLSISCGFGNTCIDVKRYIGFDLTLSFHFGWNSSETGMTVDVGELVVTSIDQSFKNSVSNYMALNSTDTNKIIHTAEFSSITYNSTVSYRNPLGGSNITHTWSIEAVNIYYPAGYNITQITLNSTIIYPLPPSVAFERSNCNDAACSVSLVALNMSDIGPIPSPFSRNSTLVIRATTRNTVSLSTMSGVTRLDYFLPDETISLMVANTPTVINGSITARTGRLNITFVDPNGSNVTILPKSLVTSSGGFFNYTIPPASSNPFGLWNITALFSNNFDMGFTFHTFRVQQIQVAPNSFNYSANNNLITVTGTLIYMPNQSPAVSVNGTVFAMDAAVGTNPMTTTNTSSNGLYISNITLVNGIFTAGQPLRMFFTVVNPNPQGFNATLTIEHEYPGSMFHGVNVTFPLDLGDQPFTFGPVVYQADIFLLSGGVQIRVTSLTTHNSKTFTTSLGLSPVLPSRQHPGLFKITIKSKPLSGSGSYPSNSLESPMYGFVLAPGFVPGKLLAFSRPFTTGPYGTFSTSFTSARILAARRLILLVLARDANGIVLGNQDPTSATDSTLLQSTLDAPSEVAVKQSVTLMLHLKNNSTKIAFGLTINLEILGFGIVASKPAALSPGGQQELALPFTAPSTPGTYTLTISSPEYGAPLLTKTLQVSLLQSNLQILIPAVIGLLAALVILAVYLLKRSPEVASETKEKQRPSPGKPSKPQTAQRNSKSLTRTWPFRPGRLV